MRTLLQVCDSSKLFCFSGDDCETKSKCFYSCEAKKLQT